MSSSRVEETLGTARELKVHVETDPDGARSRGRAPDPPCDHSAAAPHAEEGGVDNVLDILHKSLKDQEIVQRMLAAVKSAPAKRSLEIRPELSGGTAHRKPVRRRPNRPPLRESRSISSARSLVGAAESLGLDMSPSRPLISSSERKLSKRRQKAAAVDAAKALALAKHSVATQLHAIIPELEARIRDLKANGGRSVAAEKGMASAKAALRKRSYRTAIASVSGTRKALSDAESACIHRIMDKSRAKFVTAKRSGVNIDTAIRALVDAKEHLRNGDLGEAIRKARRAEVAAEVTIRAHRDATRSLSALVRSLAAARQMDVPIDGLGENLAQAKGMFDKGAYFKSTEVSKTALDSVERILRTKVGESIERAERAVTLSKEAGADSAQPDEKLRKAKQKLAESQYLKSFGLANEALLDGACAALAATKNRLGGIGEFARSVSGEIDSLSQVQDAIVHSRERSLEMVRKYSSMSEDVVCQAYDTAASYMRVSQDIVRQAYDSSVSLDPEHRESESEPVIAASRSPAAQILGIAAGDRKLRVIDLYLSGKIDDRQLDKLLSLVDSSSPSIDVSDGIPEAETARR